MLTNKNLLYEIHQNVCPYEPATLLDNILSNLYLEEGLKTQQVSEKFNLPKPVCVALRNELQAAGFINRKNPDIILAEKGIEYVGGELGFSKINIDKYRKFLAADLELIEKIRFRLKTVLSLRPKPKFELDQAHCNIETLIHRVSVSLAKHDIIGKKILCLGDDDCLSIAIAIILIELADYSYLALDLTVLDIDSCLIRYFNTVNIEYDLSIKTVQSDIRAGISNDLANTIDTVFTDPPYTMVGLNVFLSTASSLLKRGLGGKIYLSFSQKPLLLLGEVQDIIHKNGLLIENIYKKFNRYVGASILGNRSNLYYLIKYCDKHQTINADYKGMYTYYRKQKSKRFSD